MSEQAAKAERTTKALLAGPEKRLLTAMASRLPSWIVPDHLTGLALVAALGIAASYGLSNRNPTWLWGANLGLALHWLGDSLDGTLARVRKSERPRYGFYVDHLADALSTIAIGLGLGLSPYMLLAVGFAIVIAYLTLSINVYLETLVVEQFRYGYGVLGPTEARILLIVLNSCALFFGPMPFSLGPLLVTPFDVVGVGAALAMAALLVTRTARNLRHLSRLEPPRRKD
ncbi:MAG: CDP-alcohol phosphatidyltransferase family protein [Candidatus Eisenbacteria bacterium]